MSIKEKITKGMLEFLKHLAIMTIAGLLIIWIGLKFQLFQTFESKLAEKELEEKIENQQPLIGIVNAINFSIPKELTDNDDCAKLKNIKTAVYVRIQNEGRATIKDVVFNFATASFINVCKGYKCRDGIDTYNRKRSIPPIEFKSGYQVDIGLWTEYDTEQIYPEETTKAVMEDIKIYPKDQSKIVSYFDKEGRKKLLNFK